MAPPLLPHDPVPLTAATPFRRRLLLERLEDRLTPSTVTVTSNADTGANTLRALLAAASSGEVIDFAATVRTIDPTMPA